MPTPAEKHTPELLPCPICRGPAMAATFAGGRCGVKCLDGFCGCMQRLHDTKTEAIAAWNTRAPSPVNAQLLAALQGLMKAHQAAAIAQSFFAASADESNEEQPDEEFLKYRKQLADKVTETSIALHEAEEAARKALAAAQP